MTCHCNFEVRQSDNNSVLFRHYFGAEHATSYYQNQDTPTPWEGVAVGNGWIAI